MAKVAVFLADGFEEIEALTPVDILRRGGVDVTTVSIMGRNDINGCMIHIFFFFTGGFNLFIRIRHIRFMFYILCRIIFICS